MIQEYISGICENPDCYERVVEANLFKANKYCDYLKSAYELQNQLIHASIASIEDHCGLNIICI